MSPLRGLVGAKFDRLLHRSEPITATTQTLKRDLISKYTLTQHRGAGLRFFVPLGLRLQVEKAITGRKRGTFRPQRRIGERLSTVRA
jgi:hypothetical protein